MDDLAEFRHDLDRIEHRVAGEVVVGRSRVRILAGCVALLVMGLLLPQATSVTSLTTLLRWDSEAATLPLRVFDVFVVVFGILVPLVALLRRRWGAATLAMLGSGAASMVGLFAAWSQAGMVAHTSHAPHVGLYLCWGAVMASTAVWLPVVLSTAPLRSAPPVTSGVLTPRNGR
ncbi:Rv2732c family membrane protein [Rhodococcus pyridinivorans]